jgi:hypothetical protein
VKAAWVANALDHLAASLRSLPDKKSLRPLRPDRGGGASADRPDPTRSFKFHFAERAAVSLPYHFHGAA